MPQTTAPVSRPSVKTSDLVYVFCAGAWVNSLSRADQGEPSQAFSLTLILVLFSLAFALIPLEIYTGPLWQRVASEFDDDPSDDSVAAARLARVDIYRLWALTMCFAFLHVATPLAALLFIFFLGLFLRLNASWNEVVFPQLAGTRPHVSAYDKLFVLYEERLRLLRAPWSPLDEAHVTSVHRFGRHNKWFFANLFPSLGMVLIVIAACCLLSITLPWIPDVVRLWVRQTLPWLAMGLGILLMGLQAYWKIRQIVQIAQMIEIVDSHRPTVES